MLSPENDLTKEAGIDGYQVQLTYRPTDLLVHQELDGGPYDTAEVSGLREKYGRYYYFILSLSRDSKEALHQLDGGMGQYSALVQTLSFRMREYVTLTTSARDTIPVADFMLNRTFGLSQSTDLLFVFAREKARNDEWVQFNLDEFGLGVGNQRFRFRREDLDNVPPLKFTN